MPDSGITAEAPISASCIDLPDSNTTLPLPPEQSPPSYAESRRAAIENELNQTRSAPGTWVILRYPEVYYFTPIYIDLQTG
ncbi:hypothetical protein NMY22_g17624 [Coprinellus aureogranulatus]|nr:hypothetical protein NMY22_g17624 [Coprinellus aureogranulatus]